MEMNENLTSLIEKIEGMVTESCAAKEDPVITIDGVKYWRRTKEPVRKPDPRPSVLHASTLSSIVDYVRHNREGVDTKDIFITVTPWQVLLIEKYKGEEAKRTMLINSECNQISPFNFGRWHGQEEFIIALMSLFQDIDDRNMAANIAGNLMSESAVKSEDDGATVHRKSSGGVVCTVPDLVIPKVVTLTPYRTFLDVNQPTSQFIFRYRADKMGGVELSLFEADGGMWKIEAIRNIKTYFSTELPEVQVLG